MIDHITILDNGLLLLDADTHTISSRLRFIKGGNESEIAGAFYKVSTIAGYSAILPNETDEESLIDIEMLFNCTIGDPEVIHNIFNSSANNTNMKETDIIDPVRIGKFSLGYFRWSVTAHIFQPKRFGNIAPNKYMNGKEDSPCNLYP